MIFSTQSRWPETAFILNKSCIQSEAAFRAVKVSCTTSNLAINKDEEGKEGVKIN